MFNVCANCGDYRADKNVTVPAGAAELSHPVDRVHLHGEARSALAICPRCGHAHPFLRLPLLLVGGASATGKTTILHELTGRFTAAVLLEADLLWLEEFSDPTEGYPRFFETWLRLAKNIGQSGRPRCPLWRRPGRSGEHRTMRGKALLQPNPLPGLSL